MAHNQTNSMLTYFAALLAGALLPFAFAPLGWWPLAILCPAVLFWLWLGRPPAQAAWYGFLFGIGQFAVGVSWVFISIHDYGQANMLLATVITSLLVLAMALYPALQGFLLARFTAHNLFNSALLAFPASWALLEWIRSWLFSGFPWLLIGYSQIHSPLAGIAPLAGVYGASFVSIFSAGILACLGKFVLDKSFRKRHKLWLITLLLSLATLWSISFALSAVSWTTVKSKSITVSLAQGNIPPMMKWDTKAFSDSLNTYSKLTEKHWKSDLIVWPEAAIPATQIDTKNFLTKLNTQAKQHKTALITGLFIYDRDNNQYFNGLTVLGDGKGHYEKRHLVPFGEYVPLANLIHTMLTSLQIPMSNLSSGPKKQPLVEVKGINIAAFICYEIAYAGEVLQSLPQANILLTITDDGWFGHSAAQAQHLQIGQMRALETGRYLLFDANNGITAIIGPHGKVLQSITPYTRGVLTGEAQPMMGNTPFVLIGIWPWMLLYLFLFLLAAAGSRRK